MPRRVRGARCRGILTHALLTTAAMSQHTPLPLPPQFLTNPHPLRLRPHRPRCRALTRQVPIYSVTSYLGLHDPPNAVIYALIRDCYE